MIKFTQQFTYDNKWGFVILGENDVVWKPINMVSSEIKEQDDNHVIISETYKCKKLSGGTDD